MTLALPVTARRPVARRPARRGPGAGRAAAAAAALAGALAAPAAASARDALTVGISQFPASMHPYIDPFVVKTYVLDFVTHPVTAFDADWHNGCLMCERLPSLRNGAVTLETGPDGKPGMAVAWTLKPGLFWGDGVPVTTRDLAFTAKVGRDPNSGFADTRTWGKVSRVDIVDDRNAVVHYTEPSTLFDRIGTLLPEHVEGPLYDAAKAPGDYIKTTAFNRATTTPGLFNGPFLITHVDSGSQIVLEPNPHWTGTAPGFRRVVFRNIENTAALQSNLLSGDIDLMPGEGISLSIDQVLALRKQQPDRFDYVFRDALSFQHLDLQLDNPILQDVRVRRALLMAIDRKTMSDRLADGMYQIADSFVPPKDPVAAKDLARVPFDRAGAKALLKEAGWSPGADGIAVNDKGARLSLEFRGTAGNRFSELIQQVLQDQLKAVGVEAVIRNEPFRTLFGETMKHRSFTGMAIYGWSFSVSYPPTQTLASASVPTEANNWSGTNFMDWRDPRVDAAIRTTETELDPAKAQPAWAELQHRYAEQVPVVPLFFRPEAHVVPKWLKNYRPTGTSDYGALHAEEWRGE